MLIHPETLWRDSSAWLQGITTDLCLCVDVCVDGTQCQRVGECL